MNDDVIDRAAGLPDTHPLHAARRQRETVVSATQASHDALLNDPVPGLGTAARLEVAVACCHAASAPELAAHYAGLLAARSPEAEAWAPAVRAAALQWSTLLITDPRRGDRAALQALRDAGLGDDAIVALAQLVAFLSYQTRVVAGLRALAALAALAALPASATAVGPAEPSAPVVAGAAPAGPIRIRGFTNESLGWASWLQPVALAQASAEQLQVLDESHAQARTSAYYLTLVHQPRMLRHRSAAYNAIMYGNGGAPRAERELAAMVVSVTNGCVYCTSVHAQRYAQLARRHDTVVQVFTDPATAGSTPRERAVAVLARALTLHPAALGAAELAPLRTLGLADGEILDVLHAAAIFGWANRLMHNLGEPVHPATQAG